MYRTALTLLVLLYSLLQTGSAVELRSENSTVIVWAIVVLVLLIVGLLAVFIVEIVIVYKIVSLRGVPCRSIWLGQLLLLAIALSYAILVLFVLQPTAITCRVIRFCLGVCYILIQSVLTVKVLIVLSPKTQVGFLKLGHQLFIMFLICAVQVIINIEWIILKPSGVEQLHNDVTACSATHSISLYNDFLYSFIYIFIVGLCLTCLTMVTYLNRRKKNGKPNSEAKLILITCCVTTAAWLAWIIVGALLPGAAIAALSLGLWVTATATLLIMFVPKLHKLASLKDGDSMTVEEFYIDDDMPGMLPYDQTAEQIEMDSSIAVPPSYHSNGIVHTETDGRHIPGTTLERSPSVILEEGSNTSVSSVGPSPSVIYNTNNPHALELRHPASRSGKYNNFSTLSQDGGSYSDFEPPQRYYTIGGHGRQRGANSVIGAPRYDQRYVHTHAPGVHYASDSLEPQYVREVLSPYHHVHADRHVGSLTLSSPRYMSGSAGLERAHYPVGRAASVIGVPRYEGAAAKRYLAGHTNHAFTLNPHRGTLHRQPVKYVEVVPRKASSVVDVPSYRTKVLRPLDTEHPGLLESRRTLSQQDLRMGLAPVQSNGSIVAGTLPRNTKLVYKPTANGRVQPVEQRQRAFSDDFLERSSVY